VKLMWFGLTRYCNYKAKYIGGLPMGGRCLYTGLKGISSTELLSDQTLDSDGFARECMSFQHSETTGKGSAQQTMSLWYDWMK